MLGKVSKTAPKMHHMIEELLASRDTVYYIASIPLIGKDEMTLPRFLKMFGQHDPTSEFLARHSQRTVARAPLLHWPRTEIEHTFYSHQLRDSSQSIVPSQRQEG